jgi:hypothetical protein
MGCRTLENPEFESVWLIIWHQYRYRRFYEYVRDTPVGVNRINLKISIWVVYGLWYWYHHLSYSYV